MTSAPRPPHDRGQMCDQAGSGDRRHRLARRFARQRDFSAAASPLSARLCDLVSAWLTGVPGDSLGDWLVDATLDRASFEVPMLLLAGLHRDVLVEAPEMADLRRYFPTVGGRRPPNDPQLAPILRAAILARKTELAHFLGTATVQTNETARGLSWLLPTCSPGWPAVHLVDLGASAGLNLVADQRCFHLIGAGAKPSHPPLGCGVPVDFTIDCDGPPCSPPPHPLPVILSRTGCDLAPFALDTPQAEQTLAAFVWGDQTRRLAMLRGGIAALHLVNRGPAPVRLHAADLPADLASFLDTHCRRPDGDPFVVFNTYLSAYLTDKGASLRPLLEAWAERQSRPILWLQWEPLWQGDAPPNLGWLAWTADLWHSGRHARWHLAWVHPHGTRLVWLSGLAEWTAFWRERDK